MSESSELLSVFDEVRRAGLCSHPIRLTGSSVQQSTGELYSGAFSVACKDRRAVVCPACSKLYKADAWQLVVAGLRGGKGVPVGVSTHPRLFVTLTAPSFGSVHSAPLTGEGPCRPRRGGGTCDHGRPIACLARHRRDDPVLGEPLCADCFDYRVAVLWNAHVSALWQRTSTVVRRTLASSQGLGEKGFGDIARLSYLKVVEFQRRGLVHLHLVIRADGPDGPDTPPPEWLGAQALAEAVKAAVGRTTVGIAGGNGRVRWGDQLDVRVLRARSTAAPEQARSNEDPGVDDDGERIAAYIAKYSVKTSDGRGILAYPIRSVAMIDHLGLRDHPARLVRTAWELGANPGLANLRLRAHAHTFGFPGHLTTKSIRYSTTFSALRQARSARAGNDSGWYPVGFGWRYLGRGYLHPEATTLAETLLEAEQSVGKSFPTASSSPSPSVPHATDQG